MLNGNTRIIAHIGYPTTTFKSPLIYNPWFEKRGINAQQSCRFASKAKISPVPFPRFAASRIFMAP